MAPWLFWGCVTLVVWPVSGYPLVLALIARFRRHRRAPQPVPLPQTATVIITVTAEDGPLEPKLQNTLREVDWGPTLLDVIIAVDGGHLRRSDTLLAVLDGFRWQVIEHLPRVGKDACQRASIARASGEIIVFTDMATRLDAESGKELLAGFSDASIGCVSGVDHPAGPGRGESTYVRAEMRLRRIEADAWSLIGASGCLFAVHRVHANRWDGIGTSDLAIPLLVTRQGKRTVPAERAICRYATTSCGRTELQRKRRTIVHGITALVRHCDLLNPITSGFVAVQLISHKLIRWGLPLLLVLLVVSSGFAGSTHAAYWTVGAGVLLMLAVGSAVSAAGWHGHDARPIAALSFFAVTVVAATGAWWDVLCGRTYAQWTPSRESSPAAHVQTAIVSTEE